MRGYYYEEMYIAGIVVVYCVGADFVLNRNIDIRFCICFTYTCFMPIYGMVLIL